MLIAGIDDAGRGAVIGPLLIAGVLIDEKRLDKVTGLGVKDSKLLSPRKRSLLAAEIIKTAKSYHTVSLPPAEIDEVIRTGRRLHRLNRLEAHGMAEVIVALKPDIAYVDASDVLPERYKEHIAEEVPFNVQIISEHKADKTYPIVSAASIIAKARRDTAIASLRKQHGDLGSGYPSDPKTIEFLKKWIGTHGSYPEFVRKSWKPARRIKADHDALQRELP